jgi:CDGSH-type Zn-finger protein
MSGINKKPRIKITKDGPYLVTGSVPLLEKIITPKGHGNIYKAGREFPQAEEYALCRCGKSKNHPFCDGSHEKAGFNGTETASEDKFENRADMIEGPELDLMDDGRCAFARFCHKEHGSVWELTENSDNPVCRKEAIEAACECPAGRLVPVEKNGKIIEPEFDPAIEILQDPEKGVSGPLFVKGNIPIESSSGNTYEIRNRVALCRCGKSRNKPFCDAMHVSAGFKDK